HITNLAVLGDSGDGHIAVGLIKVPEFGVRNGQVGAGRAISAGGNAQGGGLISHGVTFFRTVHVEFINFGFDGEVGIFGGLVFNGVPDCDGGGSRSNQRSGNVSAPVRDVHG